MTDGAPISGAVKVVELSIARWIEPPQSGFGEGWAEWPRCSEKLDA
jgi:hypothetical protein